MPDHTLFRSFFSGAVTSPLVVLGIFYHPSSNYISPRTGWFVHATRRESDPISQARHRLARQRAGPKFPRRPRLCVRVENVAPPDSVGEFFQIAIIWAQRSSEGFLVWAPGFLGVAIVVLSPVWFLLIGPTAQSLLELSTEPIKGHEREVETVTKTDERDVASVDETVTEFIRGGASSGPSRKFSAKDILKENRTETAGKRTERGS